MPLKSPRTRQSLCSRLSTESVCIRRCDWHAIHLRSMALQHPAPNLMGQIARRMRIGPSVICYPSKIYYHMRRRNHPSWNKSLGESRTTFQCSLAPRERMRQRKRETNSIRISMNCWNSSDPRRVARLHESHLASPGTPSLAASFSLCSSHSPPRSDAGGGVWGTGQASLRGERAGRGAGWHQCPHACHRGAVALSCSSVFPAVAAA